MSHTTEPKLTANANANQEAASGILFEKRDEYVTALNPNGSHEWDALFELDPSKQPAQHGARQSALGTAKNGLRTAAASIWDAMKNGTKTVKQALHGYAKDASKELEEQARRAEYEKRRAAEVAAHQRTLKSGKVVNVSAYSRN